MFIIIGIAIVAVSVAVGFLLSGGNLLLLLQYSEFIVIAGAALGSLLISSPISLVKKIIVEVPKLFKPDHYSKVDYLSLLKSFNDLFIVAQRDGLLSIEKHIENPEQSDILSQNPKFINNLWWCAAS
jgi:chemotaxis protein MotA